MMPRVPPFQDVAAMDTPSLVVRVIKGRLLGVSRDEEGRRGALGEEQLTRRKRTTRVKGTDFMTITKQEMLF